MPDDLLPPPRTSMEDPGAHDLGSESEDHFSDARSGTASPQYPIPITPIETTNRDRYHGNKGHEKVSGASAYPKHEVDAIPDAMVKFGIRPGTPSSSKAINTGDRPISATKPEKVDSIPNNGEVPCIDAYEEPRFDAEADILEESGEVDGSPTSSSPRFPTIKHSIPRRKSTVTRYDKVTYEYDEEEDGRDGVKEDVEEDAEAKGGDDAFGDDFDDFEAGGQDEDFDDFEDGFPEPISASTAELPSSAKAVTTFNLLNFDDLDTPEEVIAATEPYLDVLFPPDAIDTSAIPLPQQDNNIFLSQRSASLWSQLVAPPPLQPTNWIRSRIRRLFLVSLGVPVDLDEILPASKQKKLILPSVHLHATISSPRNSTDSRTMVRLKNNPENASNTSLDSQNNRSSSKRRKGPPPVPDFDLVSARQLCMITDEALNGLTDEELAVHVKKLEEMQIIAKEVLEYWTKRTDEKIGDREAFEGVIENLVKHARRTRK